MTTAAANRPEMDADAAVIRFRAESRLRRNDARDIMINGTPTTPPSGAIAWKYNDPIERARWIYNMAEANEISRDDSGLLVWAIGEDERRQMELAL